MKKRSVGIFIFDEAEVLDFCGPFEVFSVTSELNNFELFDVFTVAQNTDPVRVVNGLSVNPDYSFDNAPKIDLLIIAGGAGTRDLIDDKETLNWIKNVHQKTEITISICSGARLLGRLGLLDHQEFTTHHDVFEHMKEIAPKAIPRPDKRFVDNGNIMTSGGISAGIDLSFYVVEKLLGEHIKNKTAEYMEYRLAEDY